MRSAHFSEKNNDFFVKNVQILFSFPYGYVIMKAEPGTAKTNPPRKERQKDMKLTVSGRQMTVRDSLKEMVTKKLIKFDRIFGDDAEATVTFSAKRDMENIEITIRRGGTIFRSEESADSFANAIDAATETLFRQIRRNKTRLERQLRDETLNLGEIPEEATEDEGPEFIIRKKSFPFKPMSPEEAILQMNLLEHDFFVFVDGETERTCVVYRRRDGNYGLIVPGEEE